MRTAGTLNRMEIKGMERVTSQDFDQAEVLSKGGQALVDVTLPGWRERHKCVCSIRPLQRLKIS